MNKSRISYEYFISCKTVLYFAVLLLVIISLSWPRKVSISNRIFFSASFKVFDHNVLFKKKNVFTFLNHSRCAFMFRSRINLFLFVVIKFLENEQSCKIKGSSSTLTRSMSKLFFKFKFILFYESNDSVLKYFFKYFPKVTWHINPAHYNN